MPAAGAEIDRPRRPDPSVGDRTRHLFVPSEGGLRRWSRRVAGNSGRYVPPVCRSGSSGVPAVGGPWTGRVTASVRSVARRVPTPRINVRAGDGLTAVRRRPGDPSLDASAGLLLRQGLDLVMDWADGASCRLSAWRDGREGVHGELTVTLQGHRLSWGGLDPLEHDDPRHAREAPDGPSAPGGLGGAPRGDRLPVHPGGAGGVPGGDGGAAAAGGAPPSDRPHRAPCGDDGALWAGGEWQGVSGPRDGPGDLLPRHGAPAGGPDVRARPLPRLGIHGGGVRRPGLSVRRGGSGARSTGPSITSRCTPP